MREWKRNNYRDISDEKHQESEREIERQRQRERKVDRQRDREVSYYLPESQ